jgi:hypothetical protein
MPNHPSTGSGIGLLHTPYEIMAVVTDDFAFFGHHGMTTLGTGIKEFRDFVRLPVFFLLFSKIQKGGQRFNNGRVFLGILFHSSKLTRVRGVLNAVLPLFAA